MERRGAGSFFASTEFPVNSESPSEFLNHEGDAGFGKSSLNAQPFLPDKSIPWADQITSSIGGDSSLDGFTDHLAINDYVTSSSAAMPFKPNKMPGCSLDRALELYRPVAGMVSNPIKVKTVPS